jgi:uncharacterized repeat protein (TIGR03803 family)
LAGLVQASNGDFYGTTNVGGTANSGTIFRITPEGVLTTIYSFCARSGCADGANPSAAPVQGSNGELYGTTQSGGDTGSGTIFELTPSGTLTTLHSFCSQPGCEDGQVPATGLIQATNGLFYGTTDGFEFTEPGTVFELTPGGGLRTVYTFCSQPGCADGSTPGAALVQATDGQIYGTTTAGGASGAGTIFSLSIGLNPLVELQPTSAKVGDRVDILGTDLTGATSVTFDGVPAAFAVVSATQITANVPPKAKTGGVEVLTPGTTLKSNKPFVVLP